MTDLLTRGSAVTSDCGLFRYWLERRWGEGPTCCFVMLNPSTADATEDDPTIRRCIGFAKREGCGGLVVVNLFSFRATDPADLLKAGVKNGPESNAHIRDAVLRCDGPIICAWGAHKATVGRDYHVTEIIEASGGKPMCLGVTKAGAPKHPLYLKADAPLAPFSRPPDPRRLP